VLFLYKTFCRNCRRSRQPPHFVVVWLFGQYSIMAPQWVPYAAAGKTGRKQIEGAKVKLRICHLRADTPELFQYCGANKMESI